MDDAIHRHDLEQQHKQTEEELLILKEAKKAERNQLAELLTLRDSIIAGGIRMMVFSECATHLSISYSDHSVFSRTHSVQQASDDDR